MANSKHKDLDFLYRNVSNHSHIDVNHGHCENNFTKADLIKEYIVHTYYALHDCWESDWGIVEWDNSERCRITITIRDILEKESVLEKYFPIESLNKVIPFKMSEIASLGVIAFIVLIVLLFIKSRF